MRASVTSQRSPGLPANMSTESMNYLLFNWWSLAVVIWQSSGIPQPEQGENRVEPKVSCSNLITDFRTMYSRKLKFRGLVRAFAGSAPRQSGFQCPVLAELIFRCAVEKI
jgi:hypothetical protein